MDVVRTLPIRKGRVHGGHVASAIRHGGMTVDAAVSGVVAVSIVTLQATDALVYSAGGSIVARSGSMKSVGRMTSDAELLARIG